jgi:DNA invertase Pin-like site-specific DNA recombinase
VPKRERLEATLAYGREGDVLVVTKLDRLARSMANLSPSPASLNSRGRFAGGQREGVARAKTEGKYRGQVPTAQRKPTEVVQLQGQCIRPEEIAAKLGISRASVFRVLKDNRTRAG